MIPPNFASLQDLVDAIAGKAAAGQHPTTLAELEEERARILAAQRHPSPQFGGHQWIKRQPLALAQ